MITNIMNPIEKTIGYPIEMSTSSVKIKCRGRTVKPAIGSLLRICSKHHDFLGNFAIVMGGPFRDGKLSFYTVALPYARADIHLKTSKPGDSVISITYVDIEGTR
jgi:hypothetical protein